MHLAGHVQIGFQDLADVVELLRIVLVLKAQRGADSTAVVDARNRRRERRRHRSGRRLTVGDQRWRRGRRRPSRRLRCFSRRRLSGRRVRLRCLDRRGFGRRWFGRCLCCRFRLGGRLCRRLCLRTRRPGRHGRAQAKPQDYVERNRSQRLTHVQSPRGSALRMNHEPPGLPGDRGAAFVCATLPTQRARASIVDVN
jgi:hypothetical protein